MALIPTLGFMVKQSLAIWAPLYCVYLLFFDSPRSCLAWWPLASPFASLGAVVSGCYWLWGEPFRYWAFVVMGSYHVPLLRSVQHGLVVWAYYGAGFLAALVLLRGAALRRLLGPWVIWLLFFGAETYTSGLSVTLNHIGPGSLIAGIWFLAAVTRLWPAHGRPGHSVPRPLLAGRVSPSAWSVWYTRASASSGCRSIPCRRMPIATSKKSRRSARGCRRIGSCLTLAERGFPAARVS